MINQDKLIQNVTQKLLQWKDEGILEEKLKEYGFTFDDEQSVDNQPLEK